MKSDADLARLLLRKADNDLCAADKLAATGGPHDVACFHVQQAAEKYLKAFLDAHTLDYPRTHDLETLIELCLPLVPGLADLGEGLASLEPYAVQVRYDDSFEPTAEDVHSGVSVVRALRGLLVEHMPDLG